MKTAANILAILTLALLPLSGNGQSRIERFRADYDSLGNPSGKYLFPKEKGANLRILDMNVWEWDGTRAKLPQAWREAGEDCTNEVRSKGFAGIVKAYLPEIVCLQEYSPEMHAELYPKIAGMTGTAELAREEFEKLYALSTDVIPTRLPCKRTDHPLEMYSCGEEKRAVPLVGSVWLGPAK